MRLRLKKDMKNQKNCCPKCHKDFDKPIKKRFKKFCPHCGVELLEDKSHKKVSKDSSQGLVSQIIKWTTLSSLISIPMTALTLILKTYGFYKLIDVYALELNVFIFTVIILAVIYDKRTKRQYISGVDYLADYEKDTCEYKLNRHEPNGFHCLKCGSYRMVDVYWYKRNFDGSHGTLKVDSNKEQDFIGCIKCHAQYEIVTNKKVGRDKFLLFLFAIAFSAFLFLFYQFVSDVNFVKSNQTIGENLPLYFFFWFIGTLSFLPNIDIGEEKVVSLQALD